MLPSVGIIGSGLFAVERAAFDLRIRPDVRAVVVNPLHVFAIWHIFAQ
jgi:hypothetical protein